MQTEADVFEAIVEAVRRGDWEAAQRDTPRLHTPVLLFLCAALDGFRNAIGIACKAHAQLLLAHTPVLDWHDDLLDGIAALIRIPAFQGANQALMLHIAESLGAQIRYLRNGGRSPMPLMRQELYRLEAGLDPASKGALKPFFDKLEERMREAERDTVPAWAAWQAQVRTQRARQAYDMQRAPPSPPITRVVQAHALRTVVHSAGHQGLFAAKFQARPQTPPPAEPPGKKWNIEI